MTNKEEDQKEIPQNEENEENPENPEEEEEPVDLELQKEMKSLKISDSDFANEPKKKKSNKKPKNPEEKKAKKKGQDFLDYANKNNIQINIEYEENKYQLKKKEDQKFDKTGNYNDNKKQYRGGYKNDKNHPTKKGIIYSGNKFDMVNKRPNYYKPTPKLKENKEILDYINELFSEANLNKITYIRNRLSEDGKILLDDIAKYNDIKNNNIDSQKLMEVIKDSQIVECVNENDKNYIKIKNFDKLNLLPIQQIINKNAMRFQRNQYIPMEHVGFFPPPYTFNNVPYNNFYNNPVFYNNQNMYYQNDKNNK